MNFQDYFVVMALSFSGLFAGLVIALNVREELEPGRKYFILMQKSVVVAVLAVLVSFLPVPIVARAGLYLLAVLLAIVMVDSRIAYCLLGLVFFAVSGSQPHFLLAAVLVFIYGLVSGSLIASGNSSRGVFAGIVASDRQVVLNFGFVIAASAAFIMAQRPF
ncbi:hypothetical protein HYY74_03725 [Candidatus Woesearchaeota archaeon]|nr:hypothetical protein [Candidatus Woesearchaeota archaeon]